MNNIYVLNRGPFAAYVVVANDVYEAMARVEEEKDWVTIDEHDWECHDLDEVICCGGGFK